MIVKNKRNILLFAPSGVGKTTFMGWSAFDARTKPVLFLDFESNVASLYGLEDGITIVRIKNLDDLSAQYNHLFNEEVVKVVDEDSGEVTTIDYSKFKTVIVDSISELHTFTLMTKAQDRAEEQQQKGNLARADQDQFEQQDYGVALNQMRRILRYFRDLPINFFATALAKSELEPGEGKVLKPNLAGIMADEIVSMFNSVAFLTVAQGKTKEDKQRVLILHSYPGIRVKFQTPWGKKVVDHFVVGVNQENPMSELLDIMNIPKEEKD